jgi:hypothetical protein
LTDQIPVIYLQQCTDEAEQEPTTEVGLQLAVAFIGRLDNDETSNSAISLDGSTLACKPFQGYSVIVVWQDIDNLQRVIEGKWPIFFLMLAPWSMTCNATPMS